MFFKAFKDCEGHIARIAKLPDDSYYMIVQQPDGNVISAAEYLCMTSAKAALEKISGDWTEVPLMYINLVRVDDKNACQCSACGRTLRVENVPTDHEDILDMLNGTYHFCPYCGNAYVGSQVNGVLLSDCDTDTKHKWIKHRIGTMDADSIKIGIMDEFAN